MCLPPLKLKCIFCRSPIMAETGRRAKSFRGCQKSPRLMELSLITFPSFIIHMVAVDVLPYFWLNVQFLEPWRDRNTCSKGKPPLAALNPMWIKITKLAQTDQIGLRWFGTWIVWLSIQLGMSSSQLTFICFRGVETTNQHLLMCKYAFHWRYKRPFIDTCEWIQLTQCLT